MILSWRSCSRYMTRAGEVEDEGGDADHRQRDVDPDPGAGQRRGRACRVRAVVAFRLSTTATGSTKAPSTRTPVRRSISISSSTMTQTATETASGRLPSGGAPSSSARATRATVCGDPAGEGGQHGQPVHQVVALDEVRQGEARRRDVADDGGVDQVRVHAGKVNAGAILPHSRWANGRTGCPTRSPPGGHTGPSSAFACGAIPAGQYITRSSVRPWAGAVGPPRVRSRESSTSPSQAGGRAPRATSTALPTTLRTMWCRNRSAEIRIAEQRLPAAHVQRPHPAGRLDVAARRRAERAEVVTPVQRRQPCRMAAEVEAARHVPGVAQQQRRGHRPVVDRGRGSACRAAERRAIEAGGAPSAAETTRISRGRCALSAARTVAAGERRVGGQRHRLAQARGRRRRCGWRPSRAARPGTAGGRPPAARPARWGRRAGSASRGSRCRRRRAPAGRCGGRSARGRSAGRSADGISVSQTTATSEEERDADQRVPRHAGEEHASSSACWIQGLARSPSARSARGCSRPTDSTTRATCGHPDVGHDDDGEEDGEVEPGLASRTAEGCAGGTSRVPLPAPRLAPEHELGDLHRVRRGPLA